MLIRSGKSAICSDFRSASSLNLASQPIGWATSSRITLPQWRLLKCYLYCLHWGGKCIGFNQNEFKNSKRYCCINEEISNAALPNVCKTLSAGDCWLANWMFFRAKLPVWGWLQINISRQNLELSFWDAGWLRGANNSYDLHLSLISNQQSLHIMSPQTFRHNKQSAKCSARHTLNSMSFSTLPLIPCLSKCYMLVFWAGFFTIILSKE